MSKQTAIDLVKRLHPQAADKAELVLQLTGESHDRLGIGLDVTAEEYTPTTEVVRARYIEYPYVAEIEDEPADGAEFDRWLAGYMAERLLSDEAVEAAAEAAAIEGDYDGCFEDLKEWKALPDWERQAHPENEPDAEDCEWWRRRARAALTAALAAITKEQS